MTRRSSPGFTLLELMVAFGIIVVVASMAFGLIRSSRRPLQVGADRAERIGDLRIALDRMGRELSTSRQVMFPPPRVDGAPSQPERVLIFRDFAGRFILYSFDAPSGEVRRTVLNLDGLPVEDPQPVAKGLSESLFTVSRRRLVAVLLIRDGVPALHTMRLLNG